MPSDQNPWNLDGPGRRPTNPIQGPWRRGPGGGGPNGPVPPEVERFLAWLRGLLGRLGGGRGASGGRGVILGLIVLAAIWLATGFYRVEPDEQGLVTRFGAYVYSTPPGLQWHVPWPVEAASVVPVTRINHVEIGFRNQNTEDADVNGTPARELSEESLMLTGDENIVDINATVFWKIIDAAAYRFKTRHPDETVKSAAESVLRQVVGHTRIQSALTEGRAAIEQAVTTGSQAILDQYGTGVQITQVQLQKVDPPPEVIEAFRDVQRANTDADTARNDAQSYSNDVVPRARGESAAILAQANGAKQAAISAANGEAQRFLSVYAAYIQAKDVTLRRLYIETMQDVLRNTPSTVVDDRLRGILPMLPLGQPDQKIGDQK